ncbi:alpha/beta fold hydrolase [Kribbella sp. CA-294648]|uniref:alpha/beta fold hydrolase n=1 Tax=Kribbella sp. CA-294648 TaxID=3239948 RepID=UPI003D8B6400
MSHRFEATAGKGGRSRGAGGGAGRPAFYRQIAQYDERFLRENEERLDRISTPVRILWGTDDAWIPTNLAHKLAALIPGASLHLVEGAGHLIQYDAPIALADHLRAWLTQVASRPDERDGAPT